MREFTVKRIACILTAAVLLGAGGVGRATPVPQRIVSLKPNITEILFALGAGDRVVGVTTWCNYPPAAAALPQVADYLAPNVEKVLAVRPDLVIGSEENATAAPVERLRALGLPVLLTRFQTIEATWASIRAIGERLGAPVAAEALVLRMRLAIAAIAAAWQARPRPRVLLTVGHRPLIAAGPRSLVGEILALAHGENVVTTTTIAYPRLATETVLARDPQVIADFSYGMGERDTSWLAPFAAVEAVRQGRVANLPTDLFRPGPRLAEGLHALGSAIHTRGQVPSDAQSTRIRWDLSPNR